MTKHRYIGTGIAALALAVGLVPMAARAGGPGYGVTPDGKPFKRDNSQSFLYNLDLGKLGGLTNTKAAILVGNALDALQSIKTAKITFEESDPLDRDVSGANWNDFLASVPTDVNPVIFDSDGSVTDIVLGDGASRSTLAFGGNLTSPTGTGTIVQVAVVINGRMTDGLFDPDDPGTDEMTRAVERAFMQTLNIQSSDLNGELIFDGNVANNRAVPVMYPASITGGGFAPTLDDQMSISALYPADNFQATTGVIRGKVLLPDGTTGLQGIDVIARNVTDPVNLAVSNVSGSLFRNAANGGSTDPSLRGAFELHVPPGSYTLQIRELQRSTAPRNEIFPLPGGARFYQSSPTATPADPTQATPVTVTAGQATEANITTGGQAAPAPQQVAEAEPNDSQIQAQVLPLSAVVTGNVDPRDSSTLTQTLGGGLLDRIEDLYRLVVPQRSILMLRLVPKEKVDLDLYVYGGLLGGDVPPFAPPIVDTSLYDGIIPEALQLDLAAGTYTIGVTAWDGVQNPAGTAYTLEVTTTPLTIVPAGSRPVLDRLVVGNITATGAQANWITDRDATGDALVGLPVQQVGDPNSAKSHQVSVTGLTAGVFADLTAMSQVPGARMDSFPRVFFHTAGQTPAQGPAKVTASVIGQVTDYIGDDDNALQTTKFVAIAIQNSGGDAANVQLTELTPSAGWTLATPVTDPITVGGIGSGGTAIVVVRLLGSGTGIPTVTGLKGTLTGADGNPVIFTLGGP
jgi:hypothetical protein